jgi:long chain fatty acid CoA FadD26
VHQVARWAAEAPAARAFTFADYREDRAGVRETLTWSRLHRRAGALAARLGPVVGPGDRVAILAPSGLDFVVAFLGCLYARAVAVPLFTPDLPGHADRLAAVLADCEPACVLTTTRAAPGVHRFLDARGVGSRPRLVFVNAVRDPSPGSSRPPAVSPGDLAYLQYTSGSTREPAGVMISHGNVVANARQTLAAYATGDPPLTSVGWLPLFHDMGLVLSVAAPVLGGLHAVLMDPLAFLQQPARWLRLLAEHPGAVSAAPNFAYDLCAARVRDQDRHALDLSGVRTLINGSEPVRPATVARFQEAFGGCGLRPEAHRPSYGLAEATVFVSAAPPGQAPHVARLDRDGLARGVATPAGPDEGGAGAVELVSCGSPAGQQVLIVDPDTGRERPGGRVGEIWVRGPNVGLGYWGRPELTAQTFGARPASGPESAPDAPAGDDRPWLRTGDLGVVHEGRLYVTGRIKDLIIVNGRNHYPQDLEATAQAAHPAIRRDHVAAFAVSAGGDGHRDGGEAVVLVAEHARQVPEPDRDPGEVARAVRAAVTARHGIRLRDFVLTGPDSVPRTSSGKVARAACRERYLSGRFGRPGGAGGNPA